MIHIDPAHIPFAFSLLPFLVFGICLPVTVQDWSRGRLMHGDAVTLTVGFVIVVAWYWAILHSVKSKRRDGKPKLLGRALDSWLWAPPVSFVVGLACGLSLLIL
jgi:hypothetical protein